VTISLEEKTLEGLKNFIKSEDMIENPPKKFGSRGTSKTAMALGIPTKGILSLPEGVVDPRVQRVI
jgi:hypothetical protein